MALAESSEKEIIEGHCQAVGSMKAQRRSRNHSQVDDTIGLCANDGWDRDLYRTHPELCTVDIRMCPICQKRLCRECWYAHPPEHFKSFSGPYSGEITPLFYATEEICGAYVLAGINA